MVISVRRASLQDSNILMEWRNDPVTVHGSRVQQQVTKSEHEIWLNSVFANEKRILLIAEMANVAVGTVRFDPQSDFGDYEVSITLAPEARGKGLAALILTKSQEWLASHVSVSTLHAFVQSDNAASMSLFRKSGYEPIPETASNGQWLIKSY
jgi:RimJ/RimL family protein N-acetyltransferase